MLFATPVEAQQLSEAVQEHAAARRNCRTSLVVLAAGENAQNRRKVILRNKKAATRAAL
jgi:hypothetical protein